MEQLNIRKIIMTVSQKQLEANRKNAKLGGVKTIRGKNKIKYNAMKHGLLAKQIIVENDEKKEYFNLSSKLYDELNPESEIEKILVERVITNTWRLRRCLQIEMTSMDYQRDKTMTGIRLDDSEGQIVQKSKISMINSKEMEKILRYESMIEKGLFKALNELQYIKSKRK